MDIKDFALTSLETQALLDFFQENINLMNLAPFSSIEIRHLFIGYLKLKKAKDRWDEAMKYTE